MVVCLVRVEIIDGIWEVQSSKRRDGIEIEGEKRNVRLKENRHPAGESPHPGL